MNSDAKKKKKRQPPLKLHRFAACGEVWNAKKKMCIPGSLSLSLSLSSIGEESERRGWRELAHGQDQPPWLSSPTTQPTILGGIPPYDSTCTLQLPAGDQSNVCLKHHPPSVRHVPPYRPRHCRADEHLFLFLFSGPSSNSSGFARPPGNTYAFCAAAPVKKFG